MTIPALVTGTMTIPAAVTRNSLVSLTVTTKLLTVFLPSVTDTVQVMVSVVTVRRSTAVRMMPSPAQIHAVTQVTTETCAMTQATTDTDTCHDTQATQTHGVTQATIDTDTHTDNDRYRHMP